MARLTVATHVAVAEMEQRYRQAQDPVDRSHWQIIWLVARGALAREVAATTGYSRKWVGTVVRRYNADGVAGVGDRRHANPGRSPVLSAAQRADLATALEGPAPDGGLWSGPKVAVWIAAQTGQAVGGPCGWEYLVRLGYRLRQPRPRHVTADAAAQAAFKKGGSPASSPPSPRPIPLSG